jgi:polyhydroxybutyrate depolymerase
MQDRAQDASPANFSIDTINQSGRGNDTTNATAQRLLDDVHQELHNQLRADRYKGIAGHMVDLFYDPVTTDHTRLTGIAKRLDGAAANNDYGIIAAQSKIINDELAKDHIDDGRKNTVDDIAHDVATVIPSVFKGALRAGEQAIEHKLTDTAKEVQATTTKAPEMVTPSTPVTHGGDYRQTLKVNGAERAFNIHVPASYQKGDEMPAVVMLHGITENADSFAQDTQMNAKADKEGFIAIYPEGNPLLKSQTHLAWNVPNWDIFHPSRHADDVQFVGRVIDEATGELSIDPNRTYVAGFSNGGMLAQEVAAQNSDKVAAVAIVSAALSGKDSEPSNPVSVIDIHGTADTVVPYQNWDNGFRLVDMQPVAYTGTFWRKADNIEGPTISSEHNGITVQDSVNSKTGVEVKQIGIEGGTHTWPGAAYNDGAPDKSIEATDEIWDFFSHHTLAKGDFKGLDNTAAINT